MRKVLYKSSPLSQSKELQRACRFLVKAKPDAAKGSGYYIEGLSLPTQYNNASIIQEVIVPDGINLQRSRALPAFGGRGGLEQFQILNREDIKKIVFGQTLQFK